MECCLGYIHNCLDRGVNVLLLRIVDDGHFRHGEGEPIRKLLLNLVELFVDLLRKPHLANAVFGGIRRRNEDAGESFANSLLALPLVLVLINLTEEIQ